MTKEDFLKAGWDSFDDEVFYFSKSLVSDEEIKNHGLEKDQIPEILFGRHSEGGTRFCIYTGACFVWINSTTIDEAENFANQIIAFEPL